MQGCPRAPNAPSTRSAQQQFDDEGGEHNYKKSFPNVIRQGTHEENFDFIHKRTIFVGFNLPAGLVHDEDEWRDRQRDEYNWLTHKILKPKRLKKADAIVIMAHARPTRDHRYFFDPLIEYIRDELQDSVPILYLHGDDHMWQVEANYKNLTSFTRIQHEGGTRDPMLKLIVDSSAPNITDVFQYDRQLELLQNYADHQNKTVDV